MAEGPGVAVPPDSTGARFRTQQVTTGAGVVQQEVVTLADEEGDFYTGANPFPTRSVFSDENGVPYTVNNRLPVNVDGASIQGTFTTEASVESVGNIPPGPLAANEVWEGQWEDVLKYAAIQIAIDTDAVSATNGGVVEFSKDGVNVIRAVATTVPANVQSYFHLSPQARYVRFRYTNGSVAQTRLRVSILFSYNTPAEVVQPIGATTTDLNVSTIVKSHLHGRVMSGASTGVYVPIGNDGTGRMLVRSELLQPLTDAQLRASPVVVDSGETQFKRLLKFEPAAGMELRADETLTDRYHGTAVDGTPTTAASWGVVRFYKNAAGDVTRARYRTGVVWDDRTQGWT